MTNNVTGYTVGKDYYSENIGSYLTDFYPVIYATEDEAKACLERIKSNDAREFGGWYNEGDILFVQTFF